MMKLRDEIDRLVQEIRATNPNADRNWRTAMAVKHTNGRDGVCVSVIPQSGDRPDKFAVHNIILAGDGSPALASGDYYHPEAFDDDDEEFNEVLAMLAAGKRALIRAGLTEERATQLIQDEVLGLDD